MSTPSRIVGMDTLGQGIAEAQVLVRDKHAGLVVYSEELHEKTFTATPAFNSTYGVNFAQNGAFGGTPDLIHNGTDTAAWTGSNISGSKATFNSSTRAFAGTYSVEVDNPAVSNVWEFDKGSYVTMSNYTAITLKINVDKDWSVSDSISLYAWDDGTGTQVGNKVLLENYFDFDTFDVWHTLVIDLNDLGIASATTVDAFRMQCEAKSGKAPKFYIDSFQIEETGTPIVFAITPSEGKILHITKFRFSFTDALNLTDNYGGDYGLSYDKILGLSKLTNGISYRVYSGGKQTIQFSTTCIGDLLYGASRITDVLCDGTNTLVTFETLLEGTPIKLYSVRGDRVEVVISDDLSGLLQARSLAIGYELSDHTVRGPSPTDP